MRLLCAWPSLLAAAQRAARGRRGRPAVAAFEFNRAEQLLALQAELQAGHWQHGRYLRFEMHEPKRRTISAAAFRDRVVHHALCAVIEPRFERLFIAGSYANRVGKGTHRAIARMVELAGHYPFVLRMDIRQHFPSIDHALLREALRRQIPEDDLMRLIGCILDSADDDASRGGSDPEWFDGDDLLAACRPRGLPIGNLSSQFWSNVYMHGLDSFVLRELRCPAYLRYVDDFALFGHSKAELWGHKRRIVERLARMRLRAHEASAQVCHTRHGVPWLGFVAFPGHLRVKARKVQHASKRLGALYGRLCDGDISFAEFDASVQGWINHVQCADDGGLRRHVLAPFVWPAGSRQRRAD